MPPSPSPSEARADAWASMQYQQALFVISDQRAREWEAGREAREARANQAMGDLLAHADQCAVRAKMYDAWASEYPAAHRKHHQYHAEADRQRRLRADAMLRFRTERNSL